MARFFGAHPAPSRPHPARGPRRRARALLSGALVLGAALALPAAPVAHAKGEIAVPPTSVPAASETIAPSRVYLQDGRPGRITFVWRSPDTAPAHLVIRDDWGHLVQERTVPASAQAEVVVEGLTPGERYTYRVEQAHRELGAGRFLATRGPEATHFRFAIIGDMGSGSPAQYAVAHQLETYAPEFVLALGDIIYPRGEASLYGPRFFEPYADSLSNRVFYPVLGNHDMYTAQGAPYLAAFSLPSVPGGERYYAFDYGPARFWALDSNQSLSPGSPQYEWLRGELANSRAPWKFVFFHHPIYSSGAHGSNMRLQRELAPLFSRYGVAAVFNGHDHHYERTTPQNGVTYFVSGGGGAMTYTAGVHDYTASRAAVHHFVGFTVDNDTLTGQAIDRDGQVFDAFVIPRPRPH